MTATDRTPQLLTPVEAAQELNVSRGMIYLLIKDGLAGLPSGLRSLKIGTARRIHIDEIRAFIERQTCATMGGAK